MNHKEDLEAILQLLDAPGNALEWFQKYHDLIVVWNQRVNLISKRDESKIALRHFIDSLTLLRAVSFPENIRLLDLGTGAGFPGVPLKIVRPDIDLVLLESKRKKGLFLKQLIQSLDLDNTAVFIGRAEEILPGTTPVDRVCSRAVTTAETLLQWCAPCLKANGGNIVALKGPDAETELTPLPRTIGGLKVSARFFACSPFPEIMPKLKRHLLEIALTKNHF